MDNSPRDLIASFRDAVLELHRVLMHEARVDHELLSGPIASPGALLQLLVSDPHFAWLRTLSSLVAAIDERVDEETLTTASVRETHDEIERALSAPEFSVHYLPRLQRSAEVVLAHGALRRALGRYGNTQVEKRDVAAS